MKPSERITAALKLCPGSRAERALAEVSHILDEMDERFQELDGRLYEPLCYQPEPDDTGDALEPVAATFLNPEAIGDPDSVPVVQLPRELADALVESGQCVRVGTDGDDQGGLDP